MQAIKQFIKDCLWLLWMVFFRPNSFGREVEQFSPIKIVIIIAKAILVTITTPLLLNLISGAIFELIGITFNFIEGLRYLALGTVVGAAIGALFGAAFGVAFGVVGGVAGGVAVGVAFIALFGVAFGLEFGVIVGVMGAVAVGVAVRGLVRLVGGRSGIVVGGGWGGIVALGVVGGVVIGAFFGVVFLAKGIEEFGVTFGITFGAGFAASFLRLHLLPIEGLTTILGLLRARRQPQKAFRYLKQSLAYWDEVTLLPQPFLKRFLVVVGGQNRNYLLQAATHLTQNTYQRQAAINAILEVVRMDLLRCRTIEEIAQAQQNLGWLNPKTVSTNLKGEVRTKSELSLAVRRARETDFTSIEQPDEKLQESKSTTQIIKPGGIPSAEAFGTPTIIQSLAPSILDALQNGGTMAAIERCQQISIEVAAALSSTSNYNKQLSLNRARRQLDDLLKSAIIALRQRESIIFSQIAQQWLDAVNAEIDRLTEEARTTEQIPNPYVAPRPLSPGNDVFTGRISSFRFVESLLLRPDQNVTIVLHGQPRIGKSSILRHFSTHLSTNLIPVYIDMQRAAQVNSTGGLLFNFADTIANEINRRGGSLSTPSLNNYSNEPFIVFGKFLDQVEKIIQAPENRLLLALDEFEEIETKLNEGKISKDLMPFLRNIMQHRDGISLLFAGTHTLDEMVQENWAAHFRSAVPHKVSYLTQSESLKLITAPIADFPLEYAPEAIELLIDLTHRHPCLIQLACRELVDLKNEQRSVFASIEDIRAATSKILETGDYVFLGIWSWIPHAEKSLLVSMSKRQPSSLKELASISRISETEINLLLKRLIAAEVVEEAEDQNQTVYQFQVELFRQWVENYATLARTKDKRS